MYLSKKMLYIWLSLNFVVIFLFQGLRSGLPKWEEELYSLHDASKFIFGIYPKVTGQCAYNANAILNIMSNLMGSCQPPYDFIRRYCLPIRSTIIRELIMHHTLTQKVAKFQLLQKFVSQRFGCNLFD